MSNKNFLRKTSVASIVFGATNLMNAQNLGLQNAGKKILDEIAGAFPFIAGIIFIIVAWKALSEYNDTKDVFSALKIVIWFVVALLVVIGVYQFVKSQSL